MIKRAVIGAVALSVPLGIAVTAVPGLGRRHDPDDRRQRTEPHRQQPAVVHRQHRFGSDAKRHRYFRGRAGHPALWTGSVQLVTPTGDDKIGLFTTQYRGASLQDLDRRVVQHVLAVRGGHHHTHHRHADRASADRATPRRRRTRAQHVSFRHAGLRADLLLRQRRAGGWTPGSPGMTNHPPESGSNGGCWWSTHGIAGAADQRGYTSLAAIKAANPEATLLQTSASASAATAPRPRTSTVSASA